MRCALLKGKRVKADSDLPRSTEYKCPFENCELVLRKGEIKIPHFSHKKKTGCTKYSEPETQAHLTMKECLQSTLDINKEFVEYAEIKGVRPDLVWKNKYAIEVQHSSISSEETERRNNIYFLNKLIPIWIFHRREGDGDAFFNRGQYRKFHKHNAYDSIHVEDEYIYRLSTAEREVLEIQGCLFFMEFSKKEMIQCGEKNDIALSLRFDQDAGPRLYCINYSNYGMTYTLYKEGKELHMTDAETFEMKLEELSPRIQDYCSRNAWDLEVTEPIPAKITDELVQRVKYCCEECKSPFLVRIVLKVKNRRYIAWERFPCGNCKKKTLMVFDKSYYDFIEESTDKYSLSSFFHLEYAKGYRANHCVHCGSLQEKDYISNWMNLYGHIYRDIARFQHKPPRMIAETTIRTEIDKISVKPVKKEVLYHFTYRDGNPRNKTEKNFKLLCWHCYSESPSFYHESSYRGHRI
ncbi:MAG: competence protein CoiA [Candidatus Odinarchaeota archaeon]